MNHGGNVWQEGAPSDWLDFSANVRPEGAPEWVRRALMKGMENARYYPDPQMRRARAALAKYLNLDSDWVLPTAGGISAIDMATHLPVKRAYAFSPCFSEYAQQSENRGLEMEEISLLTGLHHLTGPMEALRDTPIRDCALWLCNPLNPVGAAFSIKEMEALLKRAQRERAWLIVDEAFVSFCPERSVRRLLEGASNLLITGSMTKVLGIPGVRLGYLCGHPWVLDRLRRYQITWELNCFAEAVLHALPEHVEEISADARKNAGRRDVMRAGLEALGAFVYPSEANFLLVDFGRPVAPLEAWLRSRGILVRSCMNFRGLDDGRHLRLAVKDEEASARLLREMKEAMTCVENL